LGAAFALLGSTSPHVRNENLSSPPGHPTRVRPRPHRIEIGRRFWIWVALGFLATLATGMIYAQYIIQAKGWTQGLPWELTLLRIIHRPLPSAIDLFVLFLPWLGTNITILPGIALASWYLNKHGRRDLIVCLIVAAAGNYVVGFLLKFVYDRPRPHLWPGRGEYTGPSYPSGHAMMATSVLFVVAYLLRRERGWQWPYVAAIIFGLLTIYSRLYLGVHWPTDVFSGTVLGTIWLATLLRAMDAHNDELFEFRARRPGDRRFHARAEEQPRRVS